MFLIFGTLEFRKIGSLEVWNFGILDSRSFEEFEAGLPCVGLVIVATTHSNATKVSP